MAINRSTYFKLIDGSVGAVADGLYRKSSPFYTNPGYPAYNPTKAKALVQRLQDGEQRVTSVSFVIDILQATPRRHRRSFFQQPVGGDWYHHRRRVHWCRAR